MSSCSKILKEAARLLKTFCSKSQRGMDYKQNTEWSQFEEKYQTRVLRVGFPLLLA